MDARRHEILRRPNSFDACPTEDARRAERRAELGRAIQTEQDLRGSFVKRELSPKCRSSRPQSLPPCLDLVAVGSDIAGSMWCLSNCKTPS
jgi:hypothetical protein